MCKRRAPPFPTATLSFSLLCQAGVACAVRANNAAVMDFLLSAGFDMRAPVFDAQVLYKTAVVNSLLGQILCLLDKMLTLLNFVFIQE
jgi:hypothetical protein